MKIKIYSRFSLIILLTLLQSPIFAQFYWVGNGGDWSDYEHHWATSSGGTTFHTSAPGNDDDVIFDENSFTMDDQTVIIEDSRCHNLTMTATHSPTFFSDGVGRLYINGDANFQEDAIYEIKYLSLNALKSQDTIYVNFAGADLGKSGITCGGNGVVNISSDLNAKGIQMGAGTFNTNNHDIILDGYFVISNGIGTLNLGSSTITCSTWRVQSPSFMLDAGTSIIHASTFEGNAANTMHQYNKWVVDDYGIVRNTVNVKDVEVNITKNNAYLKMYGGATLTCESLTANTDKAHPLQMGLFSGTGFGTIMKSSGTIDLNYVTMQDIHGTGGATFNAVGTDNGNNDGWNFSPIPTDDYYWVGNSGTWGDVAHWAKTSGGSDFYTIPPTEFDNVHIDENSFTIDDQTISIENPWTIHDFDCTGATHLPTVSMENGTFTVKGNLNIVQIKTDISNLFIESPNAVDLSIGEQKFSNLVLKGGGTFNLRNDCRLSYFYVFDGIFNTNDFKIKLGSYLILRGPSTINLGSSEIELGNFQVNHLFGDVVVNAQSSVITCRSKFTGGDLTYNHLKCLSKTEIYGNNTFNTLEVDPGTNLTLESDKTQVITGELLVNGTSANYIHIASSVDGTPSTLSKSSGNVIGNYLVLKDNIATGGATFTANQSIDLGNNTGWNITEVQPRDFYWIGNGGKWSDVAHWAMSSGGTDLHNDVPGQLDNVYFDENSFSSNEQKVIIENDISIHTMDWTGVTNAPLFGNGTLNVYGDLIFDEQMTSSVQYFNLLGNEDHDLKVFDVLTNKPNFTINTAGTVNLQSDLNVFLFTIERGIFNTNNYDVHVENNFVAKATRKKELNLGNSTIDAGSYRWYSKGDSLFINGPQATMQCDSTFRFYSDEGIVSINLGHLHFTNPAKVGRIESDFYADTLTIEPGKEVAIKPTSDFTVGALILQGTQDKPISIHSTQANVQATIKKNDGIVDGQYLILKDLKGTGGAGFYAENSTNLGNVEGWHFGPVNTRNLNIKAIEVFPNPVDDFISFEIPNKGLVNLKIYDAQGKEILNRTYDGIEKISLNVQNYQSGIYYMLLQMDDAYFGSKFMKQ